MDPRVASKPFPHRNNEDGTVDSICPHCFLTVAYHKFEFELADMERRHICERRYWEFDCTGLGASIFSLASHK